MEKKPSSNNSQVVLLGRDSARELDYKIVKSAEDLRECLYAMNNGEGWKALGFTSWQAYLEDVSMRAKLTPKTLRKHARAALLESGAGIPIGTFSEGSIRPINDVLSNRKGYTEADRTDALELAIEWADGEQNVTAVLARRAAYYLMVNKSACKRLASRMRAGELTPEDAARVMQMMCNAKKDATKLILQEVSDVTLASSLFNLSEGNTDVGKEVVDTILSTGFVPGPRGTQVSLDKATNSQLLGFLYEPQVLEYADKRAAKRSELMEVCAAARQVILHNFDGNEPDVTEYPYINFMYRALVNAGML